MTFCSSGLAMATSRARPSACRGIGVCSQLGQQELRKRLRLAHQVLESVLAVLAHVGVRILAVGQEQEADRLVVRRERQAHFERAPGRLAAGGVAVEAEHQLVGQAQSFATCTGVVAVPSVATA